jgi:iron complex transport system ATP-binding protein
MERTPAFLPTAATPTESAEASCLLSVQGVTVSFPTVTALHQVTFEVAKGEIVVILGPNGAGKTTLLRAIARALPVQQGVILLDGKEVSALPVRQLMRQLSVVPQNPELSFALTVWDIVAMGRIPHASPLAPLSPRDHDAIRKAMEATDIWDLRHRLFSELSGGEQRRVLLAKALAQEPKLLLLDEPTANLDLRYQMEVVELLRRLNRDLGLTAIVVLHDLNLATMLGQRFLLLCQGRLVAMGSAEEVLTQRHIQQTYGVPVLTLRHPLTGKPLIVLTERTIASANGTRVHVVCGGGTGGEVMALLVAAGCQVTAGALNRGDSDYEAAQLLGIPVAEEDPFMPLSERAVDEAKRLIAQADVVVLTDVPFGWGNLANLQAILDAADGLVVVFNPETIAERDFVNGQATALLREIYATKRVATVHSLAELQRLLCRR